MRWCAFRDSLGRPGHGVHFHVLGVAIVDVVATLVAAWLFARFMRWPFWVCAIGLAVVGVVAHRLFRVRTTIDRFFFDS